MFVDFFILFCDRLSRRHKVINNENPFFPTSRTKKRGHISLACYTLNSQSTISIKPDLAVSKCSYVTLACLCSCARHEVSISEETERPFA